MKKVHYTEVAPDPEHEEGASGVTRRWVITKQDGAPNFAMRVFEFEAGGYSPSHSHPWEHEVFVLEGEGVVVQEDKEVPISSGDVLYIAPDEIHRLKNTSAEKLRFICLIPHVEA